MTTAQPDYVARRRRKEATRSAILETAADTFYREGIAPISMEDIAAAAGVSKPTLYKHFSTKQLLVAECLSSVDEKHFQWFVDQLARATSNTEPPAVAVFDVLDKWINSRSFRGCTFINASVQVGKTNPGAQLAVFTHKDRTRVIPHTRPVPLPAGNGATTGTVLIDGLWQGTWRLHRRVLTINPFTPIPYAESESMLTEAERLTAFLSPSTTCDLVVEAG